MEEKIRKILETYFPDEHEFKYSVAIIELSQLLNPVKKYKYPAVYPKPINKLKHDKNITF